ncbi:MAG: glycosyltransferase family 2 protein, partial [bacterium]|nr:glycosyltransferase family 2 protein [bacterium]
MKKNLSVVLATKNEAENIGTCLKSVKGLADEVIVIDEHSTDKTREIAESFGVKVSLSPHEEIFHITKQKAIDKADGDWILQLDADEAVSPELKEEIKKIIDSTNEQIKNRRLSSKKQSLFLRHQRLIEERDGFLGKKNGEIVAFFLPRRNIFLDKALTYGGVYPDGVIRLFKRGKAFLPCKSVHEQMVIDGEVGWLENDLIHYSNPTLGKYFTHLNRYANLMRDELSQKPPSSMIGATLDYL